MPVMRCQKDGVRGWKWGRQGVCFTGPDARSRAAAVGRAVHARVAESRKAAHNTPEGEPMGEPMPEKLYRVTTKIAKVDDDLGLVFGWGIISTENGEPYVDLQNEHIPVDQMLKAATDFMLHSRATDEMHDEVAKGVTVHSFPMTNEIAESYGMTTDREGWMIAVDPGEEILAKFRSGEYTGFSIGGVASRVPMEETG